MKYDVTKPTAPKMPTLGKGTECIKLLLSQASKDMHEPLVPMLFPPLGAHISGAEFQHLDLTWKELCGQMANLVADSGCNKGQLSYLVEAVCSVWSTTSCLRNARTSANTMCPSKAIVPKTSEALRHNAGGNRGQRPKPSDKTPEALKHSVRSPRGSLYYYAKKSGFCLLLGV